MSPQNLCASQRFSCHFLEADFCNEVNHTEHVNVRHPPPQPSCGAGSATAAATAIGSASGGLGASLACGLKLASTTPERSALIPPMKRRLITLSTAGNLKISPLSNQQLHQHRIYPVRRPSSDGTGAGGAPAAAFEAREATSQQSQPPPPPSTPARQPHTPSSHMEGARRELSPRDDMSPGVFYLESSSPETPPPPATPRAAGLRVKGSGDGGGGGSILFASPYLILRPVQPLKERSAEGCAAQVIVSTSGAVYSESQPASLCTENQPQPFRGETPALQRRTTSSFGNAGRAADAAVADAAAGPAVDSQEDASLKGHVNGQECLDTPTQQPALMEAARQLVQIRQQHQDAPVLQLEVSTTTAPAISSISAVAAVLPAVDAGCGGPAGGVAALSPLPAVDRVETKDDYVAVPQAPAAATTSTVGMSWTTIEVTVAVKPKACAAARRPGQRVGVFGACRDGLTNEAYNGYVRGPACGIFDLTRYLTGRDCVRHCGRWISRSQFEKAGGSTMAKWYRSIRVLPDLEPLGEWLERHDMPVLRGPARRSRKRPAADSSDEKGAWQGVPTDRNEAALGEDDASIPEEVERDATLPETWTNHMLLQHGNGGGGGGGGDSLVQRLVSTWPLSQPFLRTPAVATAAASGPAERAPFGLVSPPYFTITGVAPNPVSTAAAEAATAGANVAVDPPTCELEEIENDIPTMAGSVPGNKRAFTSSAPLPTLPALRARVSSLKISSPPTSPRLPVFNSQTPTEAIRKLADSASEPPRTLPHGPQLPLDCAKVPVLGGLGWPPPLKRPRQVESGIVPVRPRLLLHRTSASEGLGPEQPYLFAVQAPPGMLFREGEPSVNESGKAVDVGVGTNGQRVYCADLEGK
ncbi:hypothetical protein Vretimale_5783 [Volvox reticuliferus]|uniref:RlsA n=1 Tax=Volvox reticuliferus TaxID=1737510 RepID=A0A8J4G6A9_9CHLO|nr:hypothetical protein Vretifemale_5722 [Volvox reticuliferus]GIM00944.1 hypothetical protein Vretimale_5783 [Volvox reticuliferus]